jgi:GNAT superfamily N-acetyltransferase
MGDELVSLRSSEPIFPVADVVATVGFYRTVLGFSSEWLWGDPPDFGGVRWGRVGVMFAQQCEREAKISGQWHSFFVNGVDALYAMHVRNGATIHSPLEAKPWGLREYTVRDLNGHYLRFGQGGSDRAATDARERACSVAIVERLPAVEEYRGLLQAVGWASFPAHDRAREALAGARFGVVAVDGELVVGAGLVVGDGATFAYLKDIMVLPEWQGRKVGSRIVATLLSIIRRRAPGRMLVTLFTGRNLAEFYEPFGFCGPDTGL